MWKKLLTRNFFAGEGEARAIVVDRWRKLCPSCFDIEAEKVGVRYKITEVEAVSWSDRPVPRSRSKRRR